MNFKKNKFYFQSLVISIGLLLHLTGFNVFAGPGDDFAQAPTAGPGKMNLFRYHHALILPVPKI